MAKGVDISVAGTTGLGVTIDYAGLNSVRQQTYLVNSLMSNAFQFWVFMIGCAALFLGIGQYMQQNKDS